MQIKIGFTSNESIMLPVHYNHIIQAFIYNNIDKDLAQFLHDKGYISYLPFLGYLIGPEMKMESLVLGRGLN